MKASETLETAASLVSGDRAKKHGDMFHSHIPPRIFVVNSSQMLL